MFTSIILPQGRISLLARGRRLLQFGCLSDRRIYLDVILLTRRPYKLAPSYFLIARGIDAKVLPESITKQLFTQLHMFALGDLIFQPVVLVQPF